MKRLILPLLLAAACTAPQETEAPLFPQGELAIVPPRFTFPAIKGATSYRLTIRDAEGNTVCSLEGLSSPIILSQDTRRYFKKGEIYRYELLPLNKQHNPAAKPRAASFSVRPKGLREPE